MSESEIDVRCRVIGGFRIADLRSDEFVALLQRRRERGVATEVYFANSNFVQKCYPFADELHRPESLIVNDGFAIDLASLLLYRRSFAENLNGTDFTPRLLFQASRPLRVFLLGAKPTIVSLAAKNLAATGRVEVVGAIDGYEGVKNDDAVVELLLRSAPDVLLVALGNPLQEEWVLTHRGRHRVPLVICVGALFDFLSGTTPRASPLIRRLRLEWCYRLALEPRRLMRRYTIDMFAFFVHCARTHWARGGTGPGRRDADDKPGRQGDPGR
jgi:beta-1,4-glucosyltransferase